VDKANAEAEAAAAEVKRNKERMGILRKRAEEQYVDCNELLDFWSSEELRNQNDSLVNDVTPCRKDLKARFLDVQATPD